MADEQCIGVAMFSFVLSRVTVIISFPLYLALLSNFYLAVTLSVLKVNLTKPRKLLNPELSNET